MRKIILASHGELSKGLLNSAKMIVGGLTECVSTYSLYPGEAASDFAKELEKEIIASKGNEYIILTDLYGASVCSSMFVLTQYENVKLFTGMSFNMLLELLTDYEQPLTKEDIEKLIESAQKGIRFVPFEKETAEGEDF